MPLLDTSCSKYNAPRGDLPASDETKWSKKVLDSSASSRSKKVLGRRRKTPLKIRQAIDVIRNLQNPSPVPSGESLVANSTPPKPAVSASRSTLPGWVHTDNRLKAVAAHLDLLSDNEDQTIAFTFNLPPATIAAALASKHGFLDHLKRAFDRELSRNGVVAKYWISVDADRDHRLHLHGGLLANVSRPALRKIMREAWGDWIGKGRQFQIDFRPTWSEGWATYSIRNAKAVERQIGRRTFTCNFRRQAGETWDQIRAVARGEDIDSDDPAFDPGLYV